MMQHPLTLASMLYYVNIINLFQPILNFAISPKEYVPYYDRARSITSASLNELRQLLAIQELRGGSHHARPAPHIRNQFWQP
jgi:hypothetical protein